MLRRFGPQKGREDPAGLAQEQSEPSHHRGTMRRSVSADSIGAADVSLPAEVTLRKGPPPNVVICSPGGTKGFPSSDPDLSRRKEEISPFDRLDIAPSTGAVKSQSDNAINISTASNHHRNSLSAKSFASCKSEQTPQWNIFRSTPRDSDSFEPKWVVTAAQVFKCIVYVALFIVVLGSGVLGKLSVLLMVANIRTNVSYIPCKPYGGNGTLIPQDAEIVPQGTCMWFYWALYLAFCIPECLTWLRSLKHMFFRHIPYPDMSVFAVALIFESAQTIGICLLMFVILPRLDSLRAVMLGSAVVSVPLLCSTLTELGSDMEVSKIRYIVVAIDFLAFLAQCSAFFVWPFNDITFPHPALLPFSLLLTSCGWWENFASKSSRYTPIGALGRLKEKLQKTRYKSMLLLSVWKCVLAFFCMFLVAASQHGLARFFDLENPMERYNSTTTPRDMAERYDYSRAVFYIFFCAIFSAYVFYKACVWACKLQMQVFSFAVPMILIPPISLFFVLGFCETKFRVPCTYANMLPDEIFWTCARIDGFRGLFVGQSLWAWILWYGSYVWLISHIFTQKPRRLAKTDALFVQPMYSGLLVDQSVALNRRRQKASKIRTKELLKDFPDDVSVLSDITDMSIAHSVTSLIRSNRRADEITKIVICGTLWHETTSEMTQVVKSILRMDEDHSARHIAHRLIKVVRADYYDLETHLMFDDAWETLDTDFGPLRAPNEYVRQFLDVIDYAASCVHKVNMRIQAPVKFDTPYGGRLTYALPGGTYLHVHLKDKEKCRHKKRWSQVMYMYYVLGFQLMDKPELQFDPKRKQMIADNTFLLTIDGDSKFSPSAVQKLIDLMKKHQRLGSACGRIHPLGTGEDRWLSTLLLKQGYRIEYAAAADAETYCPEGFNEFFNQRRRWTPSSIGNTLDLLTDYKKAVENNDSISRGYIFYQMLVILFSLLGPAIIFTMMIFAQVAAFKVHRDKVLMWNLIPLVAFIVLCFLSSSKAQLHIAKLMSVAYAFIMMAVLVGTGIQITEEGPQSPVAIFVLSMSAVFFGAAFLHPKEFFNIFYGVVFFLCIPCTYVIMAIYSLINLNVINWGTREAAQRAAGMTVTNSKFQEWLLKFRKNFNGGGKGEPATPGTPYADPESGFSCGCARLCQCMFCPDSNESTRGRREMREERFMWIGEGLERLDRRIERLDGRVEELQQHKRGSSFVLSKLNQRDAIASDGSDRELGAVRKKSDNEAFDLNSPQMSPLDMERYMRLKKNEEVSGRGQNKDRDLRMNDSDDVLSEARDGLNDVLRDLQVAAKESPEQDNNELSDGEQSNQSIGIHWTDLDFLKKGPTDVLSFSEQEFWTEMVEKYLKPMKREAQEEADIAEGLRKLRNKVAFAMLLVNGLLVLVIYLLQGHKELLSIRWDPVGNYTQWRQTTGGKYELVVEPLKIEPIGFTIILFLTLILIIQTAGMIFHRFHTLAHILASTTLTCFKKRQRKDEVSGEEALEQFAVGWVRNLQKANDNQTSPTSHPIEEGLATAAAGGGANTPKFNIPSATKRKGRRRIVLDLELRKRRERQQRKKQDIRSNFFKNFLQFNPNDPEFLRGLPTEPEARQAAIDFLTKRRDDLIKESSKKAAVTRRKSRKDNNKKRNSDLSIGSGLEAPSSDIFGNNSPTLRDEISRVIQASNSSRVSQDLTGSSARNNINESMMSITSLHL